MAVEFGDVGEAAGTRFVMAIVGWWLGREDGEGCGEGGGHSYC